MNKKILAAAIAGALAAPAAAFAQSSVTISGRFTMEFSNIKIRDSAPTRVGRTNETALTDNTSFLRFRVVEDLGGGLQAVGHLETRNQLDTGSIAANGVAYVGLFSKTWGALKFGREHLHFLHRESDMFVHGGSLRGDNLGILGYVRGGSTSIANDTRTANVIQYVSPDWSGFTFNGAYSSSPDQGALSGGVEGDVGSGVRKGRAWNLNPNYKGSVGPGLLQVGYSYWDGKTDGAFTSLGPPIILTGAIFGIPKGLNQLSHRFYGSYAWQGFKVGFAYDDSRVKTVTALATAKISDRTAWSVPLQYRMGPHGFYAEYSRANQDKATPLKAADTNANLVSLTYLYSLSKRTALGVQYAKIRNSSGSFYNLFTSRTGTQDPLGVASTGANANAGEDPRSIGVSISHYF